MLIVSNYLYSLLYQGLQRHQWSACAACDAEYGCAMPSQSWNMMQKCCYPSCLPHLGEQYPLILTQDLSAAAAAAALLLKIPPVLQTQQQRCCLRASTPSSRDHFGRTTQATPCSTCICRKTSFSKLSPPILKLPSKRLNA